MSTKKLQLLENIFPDNPQTGQVLSIDENGNKVWSSIDEKYVTETELLEKGYLTSYIETDPTVPDWAKSATKPTYTAAEVGALPSDTVIPTYKAGTGISIADDGTISVTVAKIYSGTTTPDNLTGENGDIYLQTEG